MMEQTCNKCAALLPLAAFNKNRILKSGHDSLCAPCRRFTSRQYIAFRRAAGFKRKIYKRHPREATKLSYTAMKQRCLNPNDPSFQRYGGRGISVCFRWRESFEHFLADMGPRPSRQYSIDRIDVDGDYEPTNCRWVTKQDQQKNKRTNVFIEIDGEKKILAEWAVLFGINASIASRRMATGKFASWKAAFIAPLDQKKQMASKTRWAS